MEGFKTPGTGLSNNFPDFSLIICTYQRPGPVLKLLQSILEQSLYPNQILIIDGSEDDSTQEIIKTQDFPNLIYFKVDGQFRGLTKQRNFGITKVADKIDVICFLDDDTILTPEYFYNLLKVYEIYPHAVGAGGYILDDLGWIKKASTVRVDEFLFDGWVRKLGNRNSLRKKFGLLSKEPPGIMPEFSNGLSISFLPPSGHIYPVEFFMGGVSSFKKELFERVKFSSFFKGYGLYEDLDFCLRASKYGELYVNTAATLYHYHQEGGRPNRYKYGKMVIRNGWYVWRVKYPSPDLKSRLKWHATAFLLTLIRLINVLTTNKKKEALTESIGRIIGWWELLFRKPKVER